VSWSDRRNDRAGALAWSAIWRAVLLQAWGMLDVHVRPVWHASAACRGKIDTLYTEAAGRSVYEAARGLCAACPVLAECRAEGDRTESARWPGHTDPSALPQSDRRRGR
jgi:hypothetical protein